MSFRATCVFEPEGALPWIQQGTIAIKLMYFIIVGAGPEGSSLAELALNDGHKVAVIEASEECARKIVEKYDVEVFHGDIASGGMLEEAQADKADVLVATTGDDSVNLMTMFLGKDSGIKTLISRVNQSQHQGLFEKLGVQVLVNPEVIIAQHLYSMVHEE